MVAKAFGCPAFTDQDRLRDLHAQSVAALIRIAAAFDSAHFEWRALLSGFFWALAFIGFAVSFAPKLMRRRKLPDQRH
jgi:uncharacterized protein involved in response to NO